MLNCMCETIIIIDDNYHVLSLSSACSTASEIALTLSNVSLYSLSGLEFLSCIPGSIGGAISMNSGCYNSDISKIFFSLKAMTSSGEIKLFTKDLSSFSDRPH